MEEILLVIDNIRIKGNLGTYSDKEEDGRTMLLPSTLTGVSLT